MEKAKPQTQEDRFLGWCAQYEINFTEEVCSFGKRYDINPNHEAVLLVQGVALMLNKVQDTDAITVSFNEDGSWLGGTNLIWNTNLPWYKKD